ncbi:MAG: hypothetical protein PUD23_09865 [Prevotella sp.]|nr:hypothetical protein [Prevotella sp.]
MPLTKPKTIDMVVNMKQILGTMLAEKLLSDKVPVTLRSTACGGTVSNSRQPICKKPNEHAVINANLTRRGRAENPTFTL